MSATKLTLVFCCYNVSQYLDGIYNWLVTQPFENIEVIFVEDCSTDDTKNKLSLLINDQRMRIIQNPVNLGLSESRNVGLSHATGKYVGFPDPDDMFDLNWLVDISEAIDSDSPPVIISGMREDYENEGVSEYSKNILSKYSGFVTDNYIDALLDLEETMLFGYMNNKFYNTDFLLRNKILCKTMALKEDFELNIRVFEKINSFYILNSPYYFYKKRRDGNTLTSKYVPDYFDIHQNSVFMLKTLIESKTQLTGKSKTLLVNRFFRYLLSAVERNSSPKSGLTLSEQIEWVKKIELESKYKWFFENIDFLSGKLKVLKPIFSYNKAWILVSVGYILKLTKNKLPVIFVKMKP
ncbi:glycosyltransferase family 2 protein [Citrobacter koseri]|uniref:glycosyltransferase family 2 protein n=1 Tax=Citrobacter koseri TaxID=545 RepID=UPI00066786AE|nr:glycosyltransferase family A protein [Citrobacter koseri]